MPTWNVFFLGGPPVSLISIDRASHCAGIKSKVKSFCPGWCLYLNFRNLSLSLSLALYDDINIKQCNSLPTYSLLCASPKTSFSTF